MKKIALNVIAAVVTVLGLGCVASISPAYADGIKDCVGTVDCDTIKGSEEGIFGKGDLMGILTVIINVVVGVVGFIAVAMIVLGGINFATSQGDTSKVTKARNTILYGVVGLIMAILAFSIVNFVLANVFSE